MPFSELEKTLRGGWKPLYYLVGPQPYQLELGKRKILAALPLGAMGDLNCDVFYVGQDDTSGIVQLANSLPMMAKCRAMVLHDWHKAKERDVAAVTEYLESPADFTVLVLLAEKADGRSKLTRLAKKSFFYLEFERLYESRMRPWVAAIAEAQGVKLSREAAEFVVRAVGPDLAAVAKEIEKAAVHAGGETVEAENLAAVMAAVKEQSYYELFDAVAQRRTADALQLVKDLMDQGQSPLAILGMLGRTLRQLVLARRIAREKVDENEAARVLGMGSWQAKKTLDQAAAFSGVALREQLLALSRYDLEFKDGRSSDRAILDRLILGLCRRR
jgi:DNA polymerase-3 subunit delta